MRSLTKSGRPLIFNDAGQITARLKNRKRARRKLLDSYRKLRSSSRENSDKT
jgi:hypothetical protein